MISRVSAILFLVPSLWSATLAQEPETVFVPYTLLTQAELEARKSKLRQDHGYDDGTADELVRRIPEFHLKFTEENIRRAFPEIGPDDTRKSLCTNSIMGGRTTLVYLSPKSEQELTVKRSSCSPTDGGLLCLPLSEQRSYFFESPDLHFTLSDDVSIEEANEILTVFRDNGIEGLPEWYTNFGYQDVTRIDRVGIWHVLYLGEFFCRGCTAKLKVIVETTGSASRLVLDAEPEGMCI